MKKMIINIVLQLCVLISGVGLHACNGFTIQGNIKMLPDNSIIRLYDMDKGTIIDSSFVSNGNFALKGISEEVAKPYALQVANEQINHFVFLFFGNENIRITGTIEDLPNKLIITGSKHNDVKTALDKKLAVFEDMRIQRDNEIRTLYQEGKWNDSLKNVYLGSEGIMKKITDDIKTEEKRFIKANSNTYYSLYLLNLYKANHYADQELRQVYKSLSAQMKKTKDAKAVKHHLESPLLSVGDKFINTTALNREGKEIQFSEFFDGKYILLNFSSPGCQNSVDALPMLVDIYNNNSDKINIVTYCVDPTKENFDMFSNISYHPWTFVWNTEGSYSEAYLKYRIGATPTFFLFDKQGRLLETWRGYDANTYQKLLKVIN